MVNNANADDPTIELATKVALEQQVQEIYQQIACRAPEHKVQPSTERVAACLDLLGNPQNAYRAIHVTGTNGKTSTTRMIEALLREKGLRTGRFTSPHLSSVRERIAIDGIAISAPDFIETWEEIAPIVELVDARSLENGGEKLSFFEVFTVMAYTAFATAPIDVAIVEVGMGGQWDATNVIDADVAVLTPIALDHEKWLGATLTDIATEKLGILKPEKTLVCAQQAEEVQALIEKDIANKRATLWQYATDFQDLMRERAVGGQMVSVRTPVTTYTDIPLAMLGAYQAQNLALALTAVEEFFGGQAIAEEIVEHAMMSATSPGRLERVKSSPNIIVDAAHNPAGVEATMSALAEEYPGTKVALFSAMEDKDIVGMLSILEPLVTEIVVTEIASTRAMDLDKLAEIAVDIFGSDRVLVEPDLLTAIASATDIAETTDEYAYLTGSVVALGSIMLVAAVREACGARPPDSI